MKRIQSPLMLLVTTAILLAATTAVADRVRYLGLDISSVPQEDVFDAWRAANPQHTLETSYVTIPEVPSAVQRDLAVDKAFDVLQTYMPIFAYASNDLVADLTEAVKDAQFQWTSIPAAARDWLTTYQDRVYGVPVDADPLVLYYRRDLIDTPPTTWEELIETAKKYHGQDLNGDGIPDYGTCMITEGQFAMYAWTIANTVFRYKTSKLDGYVFDIPSDGYSRLESLLQTEGWEYVFHVLAEMYKVSQGWGLASGFGPTNAYATFKTGRCATMISFPSAGSWTAEAPNGTFMRTRMGTVRTPGSNKVFDRQTKKLVPCDADRCRFQEFGSVNRPTFMAGAVMLIIRKDTQVFDAAASFAAYFSVHADTRKPGALNPYRSHHFNASRFPELKPVGWDPEDARQYNEALYDTMNSPRTASVPRNPGAGVLNVEIERSMKEAIRFGHFANATSTYAEILARTDASIQSGLVDQGIDADAFDAMWRLDVQVPPRKVLEKKSFPVWAILLIVFALLAFAGIGAFMVKRHLKNAAAPKDATEPIAVLFISAKNAVLLSEEYPVAFETMIKEYEALVRASVSASGCYQVKRIGDAFMVVGKTAKHAVDCVVEIRDRYSKASWWRVDPNQLVIKKVTKKHGEDTVSHSSRKSDRSSLRSGKSARHSSRSSAMNHNAFEISCGLQIGQLRILYDEDSNRYDYQGPAVSEAAICADFSCAGQDLAAEAVDTSLPESYTRAKLAEFCTKKIGKTDVCLYQINYGSHTRKFKSAPEDAGDSGADSVLAALDTASGSLGRKKVSVLLFNVHDLADKGNGDKDALSDLYGAILKDVHDILDDTKGFLHSVVGGEFVITFNAHHPASGHLRKAVTAYHHLKSLFGNHQLSVSASIVSGNALVGTNGASVSRHDVCLSAIITKARALLGMTPQYSATGIHCLADASIVDDLETCCVAPPLDIVKLPAARSGAASIIHGVSHLMEDSDNDEWMYVLEKDKTASGLDSVFKHLVQGDVVAAKEVFKQVQDQRAEASHATATASAEFTNFSVAKLETLLQLADTGAEAVTQQGAFFEALFFSKWGV